MFNLIVENFNGLRTIKILLPLEETLLQRKKDVIKEKRFRI